MSSHSEHPPLLIHDVQFSRGLASDLSRFHYNELYGLAQGEFAQTRMFMAQNSVAEDASQVMPTFDEALRDAANLLGGNARGFEESRRNPNKLNHIIDGFPPQLFTVPRVVVARKHGRLLGYGYAANATSGSPVERRLKMLTPHKRWAWMREVVVAGDAPYGVGMAIGYLLLDSFNDKQPTSAYVWEANKPGNKYVQSMGYTTDPNEEPRQAIPFGIDKNKPDVGQRRWTGTVAGIKGYILKKPGAKEALELASAQIKNIS